jgi:hypothetical protein
LFRYSERTRTCRCTTSLWPCPYISCAAPEQSMHRWFPMDGRYSTNMETNMSTRKLFALSLFAAIALSSAALAQGGGGGGGGAGGGGAGGASGGAAGGASGAGGAAGTTGGAGRTGGATTGAPNSGTTGSGVNSNAAGQRPGGTSNSRDTINNQDRNPPR